MGKKTDRIVITQDGYDRLSEERSWRLTDERQEIARKLEEARAFGDLSENAEYAAAKEEQRQNEDRILELENILSKCSVVDEVDTSTVNIGVRVMLQDLDVAGKVYTYEVVGSEELLSDTSSTIQRISQRSPVGQAIHGKSVGDKVDVKTPRGIRRLEIMAIEKSGS